MLKKFFYGYCFVCSMFVVSILCIIEYADAKNSDTSNDVLGKVTSHVDTLCTSPKFVILSPIREKIMKIIPNKRYATYKKLLTDIVSYIDLVLPGCYNPLHQQNGLAELSLVSTQGIEANDWESLLPPASGYFRRFYHVYYSWKGSIPENPVLLFHIPKESGCLMGVWWRSSYNDMFYSDDSGKTRKRRKTENTGCIPATHVKIIPSPGNGLGKEFLNSHFVALHLGTQVMPNKDLCVDLIYSADNAQYLERQICEKLHSGMTTTDIDGVTASFGFDLGSKEHVQRRSDMVRQQGSSQ